MSADVATLEPLRKREADFRAAEADLALAAFTDTDLANGKRLVYRHGADIRFTAEQGWFAWDGRRWAPDPKALTVQRHAKDVAVALYDEIRGSEDERAAFRHARRSQSKPAIEAMIFLARSEPGVIAKLADFDADPMLLNVANGTLDLRNATLRPHAREDYITKFADVPFEAGADCALWESFLTRITAGDTALYEYLWRLAGYCLTASTAEQTLHFLYGLGANGKSVFCEVLLAILGEYAISASPDLIIARRHGGIPNDIARLRGVRLAMMNETSQGSRFDEAKLKDLTGGDTLSARFLHQEFFQFTPSHKLVIRGNHKPAINGTDEGIWRRLRLVPFTVAIPPDEQDLLLLEKLKAERPGILRWAALGCLEWQRQGLNPPAVVMDAARRYREESDVLGRFIAEACEVRKLAEVKSSAFFTRYQAFCEQSGERWIPSKDLPAEMERRGFEWRRTKTGGRYFGVTFDTAEAPYWGER